MIIIAINREITAKGIFFRSAATNIKKPRDRILILGSQRWMDDSTWEKRSISSDTTTLRLQCALHEVFKIPFCTCPERRSGFVFFKKEAQAPTTMASMIRAGT